MAIILSKTYDMDHGAVILQVQDGVLGKISSHTIYALQPDGSQNDVAALIATTTANVDADATALRAALMAAGWTGAN